MSQELRVSDQDEQKLNILILTHEADRSLCKEFCPYWRLLSNCYPAFNWFEYSIPGPMMAGDQTGFQTFLSLLDHSFLLILCTSASMVHALWDLVQTQEQVAAAFSRMAVATIPLRSTPFVEGPLSERPLHEYEQGPVRERACTEIVIKLNQCLQNLLQKYAPTLLPVQLTTQLLYRTIQTHNPGDE